jgi:hypothetical protein
MTTMTNIFLLVIMHWLLPVLSFHGICGRRTVPMWPLLDLQIHQLLLMDGFDCLISCTPN